LVVIILPKGPLDSLEFQIKQDKTSNQLDQEIAFNVQESVISISIEIKTEKRVWLTYMVYDEQKVLRAQFMKINAPQPLVIHTDKKKTSPYTIYGPIKPGKWTIEISILTAEEIGSSINWCTCAISFNKDLIEKKADSYLWQDSENPTFNLKEFDANKVYNANNKWFKGDFHTHTIYSDGEMTREDNMISAAKQKLDFFVATEHNLVPTSWFSETEILVIPGIEVTSPLGHFNILSTSTSPFSNNRLKDMYTEEGMNKILTADYGNAVISINYPFLTEWKWLLSETPLNKIDTMEIWNDPTYPYNVKATERALLAWNYLLNDGYNITGIGGSDSHFKPTATYEGSKEPSLIGDPGTFVYCNKLTATNVVRGLKKGNVTVSRGELIQFQIDDLIPGDHSNITKGTAKAFIETEKEIYFEWILDGQIVKKDTTNRSEYMFNFNENDSYHWIRVDVRNVDGSLYGFSNPIYFGDKQPTLIKWGQLLDLMND